MNDDTVDSSNHLILVSNKSLNLRLMEYNFSDENIWGRVGIEENEDSLISAFYTPHIPSRLSLMNMADSNRS